MPSRKKNVNFVFLIVTWTIIVFVVLMIILTVNSFCVRFSDHTFHCGDRNTTTHGGKTSVICDVCSTCENNASTCCRRQNITEKQSYIPSKVNITDMVRAVGIYVTGRAKTYGDAHNLHYTKLRQNQPLVHATTGTVFTGIGQDKVYDNNSETVHCSDYQTITFTAVGGFIELFHNLTPNRTLKILIQLTLTKTVAKCNNIDLLTSEKTSGTSLGQPANTDANMLEQKQGSFPEMPCVHTIEPRTMSMETYFSSALTHHPSRPRNHTKTRVAVSLPHSQTTVQKPQHVNISSGKMLSSDVTRIHHTDSSQVHRKHPPALSRKHFSFAHSIRDVLIQRLAFLWMCIFLLKMYMGLGGFSDVKYNVANFLHSLMKMCFLNYDKSIHVDTDLFSSLRFHKKSVWASYDDELFQIILPPHARTKQTRDICLEVPAGCRWCSDTLCDKCQKLVSRNGDIPSRENDHVTGCLSRRAEQWEVEVRPVRRFLPDTTNNPDLDLAHVGYRLATLSALPPAVPVSRVKLADAGFYYRGQGDEVTCYACRGRHSGWTNDDKPWDVHRRISPNCPHVLEAPGGSEGSTATTGVIAPPVSAPRQDPQSAPPTGSMQATPQEVASQASQLVTSQGSSEAAAPSLTSPRIANAVANNPQHMINGHNEAHFEDGDLANSTSLNTTTLTPALARTEAGTVAGQEQVGPSPLSGAQETMPPVYSRSQVFTSSVQSSATNNPPRVLESGPGRTEAANTPAGRSRTDSSGGSNVPGAEVCSRNVSATTAAEGANRSQAVPGDNTPGVGSGGGPGGRPNVTVGTASAVSGGGANNTPGGGACARFMFPRAGLELGGAVYPMYQDMASRRRSFPRWDETHAPPLDQIILCGMFYAGYADCVRCFYCGVGLKHWELTDDVWTEHVRWRPSCGYLRAVKGDDFIRRVQARLAREASGDDDNDGGPGDGNDRPLGPPGPPRPQERPGTTSQDRESRGDSRSGAGSSALTRPSSYGQDGDARSAPPSDTTVAAAPSPQSSATSGIPSLSTTVTAGTTATAPSTIPAPSSAAPTPATFAASPPESSNNQPSTRPEGGTSISVVEGETHSQRVARLQAENAELARRLRCKVCHREPIDTIIMPCGHLVVCENCARNTTQCPLCHGRIRATARVHMS